MRTHSSTVIRHLGTNKTITFLLAAILGSLLTMQARDANGQSSPDQTSADPIQYASETRTTPRPLHIHRLKIDLHHKDYELAVAMGPDPDGDGPVEAALTLPGQLSQRAGFRAAVNTNAWKMVRPGAGYVAGGESDIAGWAKTRSETRSPPERANWSFWIDPDRRAHISSINKPVAAQCAVSGFGGLIQKGKILPAASDVLHPRTALGLDRTARWLTLVVVDGRRPGYSEGVSLRELAEIMQQADCWDALNLDGGGSSIMLLANEQNTLQTMNRPSGSSGPRPIPVMLGLRPRRATSRHE